jgi:hypothetical protein
VDKFRTPTKITELLLQGGTKIPSSRTTTANNEAHDNNNTTNYLGGTILQLVCADWAVSQNLHVDILDLPSASQLVPVKAGCVEFYYVVQGNGYLIKGENSNQKDAISTGCVFIVDPGW